MWYNSKGVPLNLKGRRIPSKGVYYYSNFHLRRVPTLTSSKEEVFDYIVACVQERFPDIDEDTVEEVWDDYEKQRSLIIRYFTSLKDKCDTEKSTWRRKAYEKAIEVISSSSIPITSGEHALEFKGIGSVMSAQIDEILLTGKLRGVVLW